jgi:hypothetical protein
VGRIDVMLRKIDEGLATVKEKYADVKDADTLPDDLLYAIRNLVQDCQSALDWTMSDVYGRYVANPKKWSPYFPLAADRAKFVKAMSKDLPDIQDAQPEVWAAFERHQPYRAGNEAMGCLHKLSGENKHRQFSTQKLDVRESVHPWVFAGGSVETIPVVYGRMYDRDGVPIPGKESSIPTIAAIGNIDWRFTDPDVSVLPTLQSLAAAVRDAVLDVRATAGIQDTTERPLRVTHPRGALRTGPQGPYGLGKDGRHLHGPDLLSSRPAERGPGRG